MTEKIKQSISSIGAAEGKLVGIRGWLILPAIGLVWGSVVGISALSGAGGMYPDVARAGHGGVYALELNSKKLNPWFYDLLELDIQRGGTANAHIQ